MWQAAGERSLRIAGAGADALFEFGELLQQVSGRVGAHLRGHAGHARATKRIEDEVAWLGVVEDIGDDAARRDLRVVGVRVVDRVVFPLLDVRGKRRPVVVVRLRVIRPGVFRHEVAEGLVVIHTWMPSFCALRYQAYSPRR